MTPRFETLLPQTLVGHCLAMRFAHDRTAELWYGFRKALQPAVNARPTRFFSVNVYGPAFDFGPATPFEKWAAVEMAGVQNLPEGMETFILPGGLYAVFRHRGPASEGPRVFGYIFGTWLPASGYALDDRPHFEVLSPDYRPDDPEAEEEIFIPVRPNA
jgi:AraC family transcriptional regulator